MKKKLFLILTLLLITGCSYDYNLTVTHDKKYKEELIVVFPKSSSPVSEKKLKSYIKEEISNYKKSDVYKNYDFKYKIKGEEVIFTVSTVHNTFEEFQLSPFYKEYFQRIYKNEAKNYTVSTGGDFINPNLGDVADPNFKNDNFNINIKFHNKVASTNSNKSDQRSNVYTWEIGSMDKDRTIEFSLTSELKYDIIILDYLNDNKMVIIPLLLIIITVSIGGFILYSKNKLNNRI